MTYTIQPGTYQGREGGAKRVVQVVADGKVFYRVKGLLSVSPLECTEDEFRAWIDESQSATSQPH